VTVGDPVLAPVGHHHGAMHGESRYVTVRLGVSNALLDDTEYATWMLAHGAEGDAPRLLTAAELAEVTDPDVVGRLLSRGLLAEVPVEPEGQAAFAAAYRLVPVVFGLGNAPSGPGWRFWAGLPGDELGSSAGLCGRWAELTVLGYEIWRWSAATRSLADACQRLVTVAGPVPVGPRIALGEVDSATALDHGVQLIEPLVTGWTAVLQPASDGPLVPDHRLTLPAVEPVDPALAEDPEEILELPLFPGRPGSASKRVSRWEIHPGHPGAAGWLFAVGHDGGPLYHPADGAPVGHTIRVGAEDHRLTERGARFWELTRAVSSDRLWTRTALAAAAVGEGLPDAAKQVDELVEQGVLVEVHPGTEQAEAFARCYRLLPLLHGLGNPPDKPDLFALGVPGRRRVTFLLAGASPLWRMAGQWRSLWDVVTALTSHLAGLGRTEPRYTDPHAFLTYEVFHGVRKGLADGIVYLDLAP
jgi:hypothetical protein